MAGAIRPASPPRSIPIKARPAIRKVGSVIESETALASIGCIAAVRMV